VPPRDAGYVDAKGKGAGCITEALKDGTVNLPDAFTAWYRR